MFSGSCLRAISLKLMFPFLILFAALVVSAPRPAQATFSDSHISLTGMDISSVAWGDYDSDGDLDLVITGSGSYGNLFSTIYNNDGGTFTDISAGLTGVNHGSSAWGDYDNDGDLDLVVTGYIDSGSHDFSAIYNNDGGTFTDIGAGLTEVAYSSSAWGDYDNDGDLDLVITGTTSSIYNNDGGTFTDIGAGLPVVTNSSSAWGDYDNDGDLDLVITGDNGSYISRIYNNDGGTFTDISAGLTGVAYSSSAWGDYDNDGDLDLVITGCVDGMGSGSSTIYNNDGGTFTDISAGLTAVAYSSSAWGDYDNDGDLDLVVTGFVGIGTYISTVYRNDNGTFTDISAGLTGVYEGSSAWADYDNDKYLDLVVTGHDGSSETSTIYHNEADWPGSSANNAPEAPGGLEVSGSADRITLSWDASSDDETPADGLSYNIRVGTSSEGVDTVSPMAAASGWRKIAALGGAGERLFALLEGLEVDTTYHWNVQAVDTAFAGSVWSGESQFGLFSLTVTPSGTGSGTVTSNPAKIDCGSDCSGVYLDLDETVVTLTAVPDGDSIFNGWIGGGCQGTGNCTVTMDQPRTVVADFALVLDAYPLIVETTGSGSGAVTSAPAGIDCGETCDAYFTTSSVVTLTAAADTGSEFTGWTGGGCSGTGDCTVTMDQARTVYAAFAEIPTYTLTVGPYGTGSGAVTSSPAGLDCGTDCSEDYSRDTDVTLTAVADTDSVFSGWTGGGCSGTGDCIVTMDRDRDVTAIFERSVSRTLTVTLAGEGQGSVSSSPAGIDCGANCTAEFEENTAVVLIAAPRTGSAFTGWSGTSCTGTGACMVAVTADMDVTAAFGLDADSDGAGDDTEDDGPNDGDGNDDGVPDSEQTFVATFPSANGEYVTLVAGDGVFASTSTTSNAGSSGFPEGCSFPASLYGFSVADLEPGQSTTVTLLLHGDTREMNSYYKYGPTPDDASDHWYEFLKGEDNAVGAAISATETSTVVVLHLTDGAMGDADLEANGTIVDPGGPAVVQDQGDDSGGDSNGSGRSSGSGGIGCFVEGLRGR